MKYSYRACEEYSCKSWMGPGKTAWNYTTSSQLPVFGDVQKKQAYQSEDVLVREGQTLIVEPYRKKLGPFRKVIGYLPCMDEQNREGCIRIIGTAKARIFSAALLIFVILGAAGVFIWYSTKPPELQIEKDAFLYEAPAELVNENPEKVAVPAYDTLYMNADSGEITTPLINVEGNPCYFQYRILLKETEEEIYRSNLLEPGTAVYGVTAEKKLEAGDYDIIIEINAYALEDHQTRLSQSSVDAQMNVSKE